jgi:hypothetical protein
MVANFKPAFEVGRHVNTSEVLLLLEGQLIQKELSPVPPETLRFIVEIEVDIVKSVKFLATSTRFNDMEFLVRGTVR